MAWRSVDAVPAPPVTWPVERLLAALEAPALVADAQGHVTQLNAACALLAPHRGGLLHRPAWELGADEAERDAARRAVERALRGLPARWLGRGHSAQGRPAELLWSVRPLSDAAGQPEAVLLVAAVLPAPPEADANRLPRIDADPDGRIRFANAAAQAVCPVLAAGPDRTRLPGVAELTAQLAAGPALLEADLGPIRLTVRPSREVTEEGAAAALAERRRLEAELASARAEAAEASRLKAEFLANVSHELRTPLNGIVGMLSLLLDTPLGETQRDYAETVRQCAESLRGVLDSMLDFASADAGRLALEPADADVAALVSETVAAWQGPAADKGLSLTLHIHPTVPRGVRVDPNRLRQVLANLIGNAVKFTDAGRVAVRVDALPAAGHTARLRFEVEDTGIGLSAAQQARLFQPFVQADGSLTRRYGGAGLGLAICRQLVDLMGGSLGVDSQPGCGSRFWFTVELPRLDPAPGPDAAPRGAAPPAAADDAPDWVLVVEDNPVNRKVATRMLEKLGWRVDTAGDGREAVAAVQHRRYAAVLMDCQMPEMDGCEATATIRRLEAAEPAAARRRLPIIAVTAHARDEDRERCAAAGMDDYLPKPVSLPDLADALRRWVLAPGE